MSGGDSAQQGATPPAGQPTGSPFGRFKTVVVGVMVAMVASAAALQYASDGGGGAPPPPDTIERGIVGSWTGEPTASGERPVVRLELADDGTGTLTRGRCAGTLAPVRAQQKRAVFDYTDTSGRRGCPRRMRVRVTLVDEDTLRVVERRRGRTVSSERLRRG